MTCSEDLLSPVGQMQRRSMPSGRLASSGTHVGQVRTFANVGFRAAQ
jgi:hypothetical protein